MRDVALLFLPLIVTVVRLARPGGLRSVVAHSLLVKQQLRILNRGRKRAPKRRGMLSRNTSVSSRKPPGTVYL
jgi:hypothetical protein